MMKLTVFCVLSLPLLFFSWRCLFTMKKHGLYRFVTWECILWIAVQNYQYLLIERFDGLRMISSLLMVSSLVFVLSSVYTMWTQGQVSAQRQDETLFGFEKTTELVTSGLFHYIRHPMYSSLLFLLWGVFLRNPDYGLLIVALVGTSSCVMAAVIEERENLDFFGENYRQYMQRTKRFIPLLV